MPYSGTLCKVETHPTLKSKTRVAQEGGRKNNAAREPTLCSCVETCRLSSVRHVEERDGPTGVEEIAVDSRPKDWHLSPSSLPAV